MAGNTKSYTVLDSGLHSGLLPWYGTSWMWKFCQNGCILTNKGHDMLSDSSFRDAARKSCKPIHMKEINYETADMFINVNLNEHEPLVCHNTPSYIDKETGIHCIM